MEVELRRSASENVNLLLLSFLFIWPSAFRNMALLCWSHGNQIRSRFSVWTVKRSLRASDSPWVESISQCCPDLSTGVSCVCADTGHWPSSVLPLLKSIRSQYQSIRISEYRASLNYQLKPSLHLRDRSNSTKEFSSDLIDMNQLGKQRGHYQSCIQEFTKNCLAILSFLSFFPILFVAPFNPTPPRRVAADHIVDKHGRRMFARCGFQRENIQSVCHPFRQNPKLQNNCCKGLGVAGGLSLSDWNKEKTEISQILLPRQLLDIWRHLLIERTGGMF